MASSRVTSWVTDSFGCCSQCEALCQGLCTRHSVKLCQSRHHSASQPAPLVLHCPPMAVLHCPEARCHSANTSTVTMHPCATANTRDRGQHCSVCSVLPLTSLSPPNASAAQAQGTPIQLSEVLPLLNHILPSAAPPTTSHSQLSGFSWSHQLPLTHV